MCFGMPTTEKLQDLLQNTHEDDFIKNFADKKKYPDVEYIYRVIEDFIECTKKNGSMILDSQNSPRISNIDFVSLIDNVKKVKEKIRNIMLKEFYIDYIDPEIYLKTYQKLEDFIRSNGDDQFQIFTTNYDTVIETYCDDDNREVVDGFDKGMYSTRSTWNRKFTAGSRNPIFLTKIHGSINWEKNSENIRKNSTMMERTPEQDVLIVPTLNDKDYSIEPFTTLINIFKDALDSIDVLLVIGYSFRDNDINKIIKQRLEKGGDKFTIISISRNSKQDIRAISANSIGIIKDQESDKFTHIDKNQIYTYNTEFGPEEMDDIIMALKDIYAVLPL